MPSLDTVISLPLTINAIWIRGIVISRPLDGSDGLFVGLGVIIASSVGFEVGVPLEGNGDGFCFEVGSLVGCVFEAIWEGNGVGLLVGLYVANCVGLYVGGAVGLRVGRAVGRAVGTGVGGFVGDDVGLNVRFLVGELDGNSVGFEDGSADGNDVEGEEDGAEDGAGVLFSFLDSTP